MNYARILAVLMVTCFIASIALFCTRHMLFAGISLWVSAAAFVLLFVRGASVRNQELDEPTVARD